MPFLFIKELLVLGKNLPLYFGTWLPNSEYALDNRPHCDILGKKYKNDDPSSEEEIWVPIKLEK